MKSGYTYYVQNAHGDVVNLTDADGVVTKTYRYDAFGVEHSISDADTNAFRYCGEYFDAEMGTVYLRARYYNPSIGRFTQRDSYAGSAGNPLSLNLYTYAHNNPLFYFDPSGHSAWTNFWDEAADCWKVGSNGFRDSWNVGIKSLSSGGKTSQVFASFSQGVVDTFSSQAVSIVKTVRNPGTAIKNVVSDYIAHGKKNPTNWDPATYLGTKIGEGIVSQWKTSYNLGLNYGLNGVAYGLGQGTAMVAETAVASYGTDMTIRAGIYVKNNMPRTVKGYIYNGDLCNPLDKYLSKDAPLQVTPGTYELHGQHLSGHRVQPWKAYYDQYGRLIARTDYNAGNPVAGIPDTHYHLYEYGSGVNGHEYISHAPGEYIP